MPPRVKRDDQFVERLVETDARLGGPPPDQLFDRGFVLKRCASTCTVDLLLWPRVYEHEPGALLVAITVILGGEERWGIRVGDRFFDNSYALEGAFDPSTASMRLGWDVADGGMLSGLTNCGYGDEHADYVARWAARLNAHHLFEGLGDALDFRDDANRRVPEHAPFYVYGLYRRAQSGPDEQLRGQ